MNLFTLFVKEMTLFIRKIQRLKTSYHRNPRVIGRFLDNNHLPQTQREASPINWIDELSRYFKKDKKYFNTTILEKNSLLIGFNVYTMPTPWAVFFYDVTALANKARISQLLDIMYQEKTELFTCTVDSDIECLKEVNPNSELNRYYTSLQNVSLVKKIASSIATTEENIEKITKEYETLRIGTAKPTL